MLTDLARATEATIVAWRETVSDDRRKHRLYVLRKHAGVRVHQRPGLCSSQQRDHGAGREARMELRGPARLRSDRLDVIEERVRRVHLRHLALQAQQLLRRKGGDEGGEQVAAILPEQELPLEESCG